MGSFQLYCRTCRFGVKSFIRNAYVNDDNECIMFVWSVPIYEKKGINRWEKIWLIVMPNDCYATLLIFKVWL